MSDNNIPFKSRYPELKLPEDGFKSNIPSHLLDKIDDPAMKWLMEEMSKNTQATEFALRGILAQNDHLRELNGRTAKNEKNSADNRHEIGALKNQMGEALPPARELGQIWSILKRPWVRYPIFILIVFSAFWIYPAYVRSNLAFSDIIPAFIKILK